MKSDAMKLALQKLETKTNLSQMTALEFFAREGDWQTLDYVNKVKTVHAWEIDPQFEANLRKNLPNAHIRIGDSYSMAKDLEFKHKFDFIVLDNPQNVFAGYCEHFEALPLVKDLAKKNSPIVLFFNVNKKPFNYQDHPAWQSRRSEYYGRDASDLSLDFLKEFYVRKMQDYGFKVEHHFFEARDPAYLYYSVFLLSQ